MSEKKAPKLRFKGYTDDWVQCKLGEILSHLYNGQTPSRNVKNYWNGDIPWLTSGELNHGIVNNTLETISESGKKSANLRLIPSGTIVIAITGLEAPGTRGNCAILGINTTVNQSVMALFVKNNIDTQFVFQWYKKIGQEYGIRYTQGTKQQSYNYDIVKILPISIPLIKKEQEKIGKLLIQFDSLITLQQRKVDQLNKVKKALLQQLFPEQASYIPKTRFSQFTDPWEQRKLGEMGKISRDSVSPNLYPKNEFIEYSMPAYDLGKKPQIVMGETMLSNRLKIKGDLLLINKLNVHQRRIWLVNEAKENSVSSTEFLPYSSSQINLRFLNQFLLSDRATRDLISISSGSSNSQKRIIPSDLLNYSIYVPTIKEEQSTIGNYFSNFDSLIDFHRCKLDQLKQVKKFLLQNMFI